jgi:predicted RNA-binding protein YlxR (DUF448 family)
LTGSEATQLNEGKALAEAAAHGDDRAGDNRAGDNRAGDKGPERRCIASGEVRPKAELLRFVVSPDGTLVFDLDGRLPGRGLWLLPRRTMLEKAARRRQFQRAAKGSVEVPADLADRVAAQLRQRCIDTLGLATRAGRAVAGFEKVRARLRTGDVAVLLAASDGREDGRRKLANLAAALSPDSGIVDVLSAEEIGAALGRPPSVHAAIGRGRLAERFLAAARMLAAFEETDGGRDEPGRR